MNVAIESGRVCRVPEDAPGMTTAHGASSEAPRNMDEF